MSLRMTRKPGRNFWFFCNEKVFQRSVQINKGGEIVAIRGCHFKTWLCRIGKNVYFSWKKKQNRLTGKEVYAENINETEAVVKDEKDTLEPSRQSGMILEWCLEYECDKMRKREIISHCR